MENYTVVYMFMSCDQFLAVNIKILYFDCDVIYFTLSFTVYDCGGGSLLFFGNTLTDLK